MEEKYILALDIGTTTIRSFIYNSRTEVVGNAFDKVILHYPQPGYVEIDPDELWGSVLTTVQESIKNASLSAAQITAMGISTQRSTFITWSKKTGLPFHRFITWKDMRADKLVKQWNESYIWKLFQAGAYVMYLVLRNKRFRAGSVLKFMNTQTTLRLAWALQHVGALRAAAAAGDARFGTLDTWLLHKLSGGRVHMSDVSSASATGFFDPFTLSWSGWAPRLFGIPRAALPALVDTAGDHFGSTDASIFGHAIPIRCSMADQSASMWGSCCFSEGDVKLTMGTGTFLDVHTGRRAHAGVAGLYPVVGWRRGHDLAYVAEGSSNDTATVINWGLAVGLYPSAAATAAVAGSVPDAGGVCFIPAFSGLGPPFNDGGAAAGFVGLQPYSAAAHLTRALLEALAFRAAQLAAVARREGGRDFHTIRLDGGVSNNDFIAQLVADLTGLRVERARSAEQSARGAALLAGLQAGVWKSKEELKAQHKVGAVFLPREHVRAAYEPVMARWEDAARRLGGWYTAAPAPGPAPAAPPAPGLASFAALASLAALTALASAAYFDWSEIFALV